MVSICRISVSRVLFFLRRRRVCMRSMLTSLAAVVSTVSTGVRAGYTGLLTLVLSAAVALSRRSFASRTLMGKLSFSYSADTSTARAIKRMASMVWRTAASSLVSLASSRTTSPCAPRFVVLLVVLMSQRVHAVCATCRGACDGCAGGDSCPWLATVAANAAVVVATATAGAISIAKLLPPDLLRAFPRQHLEKIRRLAQLPPPGSVFDFNPGTTTITMLRAALTQGLIGASDARGYMSELVNAAPDEKVTRLLAGCKLLGAELDSEAMSPLDDLGGLHTYILATISTFVLSTRAPVRST